MKNNPTTSSSKSDEKRLKIGVDFGQPGGDYTMVIIDNNGTLETVRYDWLMNLRWYRNPIKRWLYRKVIKFLTNNKNGGEDE